MFSTDEIPNVFLITFSQILLFLDIPILADIIKSMQNFRSVPTSSSMTSSQGSDESDIPNPKTPDSTPAVAMVS